MQVATFIILAKQIPRSGRIIHLVWSHKDSLDFLAWRKILIVTIWEKNLVKGGCEIFKVMPTRLGLLSAVYQQNIVGFLCWNF
tara:strand:- start:40 stop:288 length:249 start_codon:yes stop_codon:yes gene_type:complete